MEELKKAFYEVMYKYEKSFSEHGVMTNLNLWAVAKKDLLALLRRHPNWNEEAKAIVLPCEESRNIDHDVVDELAYTMEDLADEILPKEGKTAFLTAFRAAVGSYSSTLPEEALAIIRESGEIKCVTGQKTSRIIGRLCSHFSLDRHPLYNAVFAQLSDALNPMQNEKTAVLSIHPCDYLEMSSRSSSWQSCHRLNGGSYQAGTLSYMTDKVSMVFYTVDPNVKDHFYRAPRRTRQMFFYKPFMLYQSRLYPDRVMDITNKNRSIVQRMLATCTGLPNLWTLLSKKQDLTNYCKTVNGGRQYPDYKYEGVLAVLKGTEVGSAFDIGASPKCVCCGKTVHSSDRINCYCAELVVCSECGQTVPRRDAAYIHGTYQCKACRHICAVCGEPITGTPYPAIDRNGNTVEVCTACSRNAMAPCATCSVQRFCRLLGNSLCPRTSVTLIAERSA